MMMLITLIWIICISICNGNIPSKLYGGTRVEIGQYPFVTSLQWKGRHQCGGSIISPDTIITSASCVVIDTIPLIYQSNLQVLIGTDNNVAHHGNGLMYSVKLIIAHKNYEPRRFWSNDLALLKLEKLVPDIFLMNKLSLPSYQVRYSLNLVTVGWGGTSVLNKIMVDMETQYDCSEIYGTDHFFHGFCGCITAVDQNSYMALGDSGNPVIYGWSIAGVISVFNPINPKNSIITKVYRFNNWIETMIKKY